MIETDNTGWSDLNWDNTQQIETLNKSKTTGDNHLIGHDFMQKYYKKQDVFLYFLICTASAQVQHCPLLLISCYLNNSPDVLLDVS